MTAQIDHPIELAARRLDDLDPAYVARVAAELRAGPITPERVQGAVHELAGLGHVVQVETTVIEEIDGEWFGGGLIRSSGRSVWFWLDETTAREVADYLATDPAAPPIVPVPPAALHELPADALA